MKAIKVLPLALFVSVTGCVIGDNDPPPEIAIPVDVSQLEDGTAGRIVDNGLTMGEEGGAVAFLIKVPKGYHVSGMEITADSASRVSGYVYCYTYVGNDAKTAGTCPVKHVRNFNGRLLIDFDVSHPNGELLNSSRISIVRNTSESVWISDITLIAQLDQ